MWYVEIICSKAFKKGIWFQNKLFLFSDPCSSNPCQNGAKCLSFFNGTTIHCDCKSGFEGKHCEKGTSKDKIENLPCKYLPSKYGTWPDECPIDHCPLNGSVCKKILALEYRPVVAWVLFKEGTFSGKTQPTCPYNKTNQMVYQILRSVQAPAGRSLIIKLKNINAKKH